MLDVRVYALTSTVGLLYPDGIGHPRGRHHQRKLCGWQVLNRPGWQRCPRSTLQESSNTSESSVDMTDRIEALIRGRTLTKIEYEMFSWDRSPAASSAIDAVPKAVILSFDRLASYSDGNSNLRVSNW